MNTALFAKYNQKTEIANAIKKIDDLKKSGATPIVYDVLAECVCSEDELNGIFLCGSIEYIADAFDWAILSTENSNGIWQCIKLTCEPISVLIFTAGTSDLLYYSIL